MKTSSWIIALCLMAFILIPVNGEPRKILRVGVEGAYPPFSETMPDGTLMGFDIDFSNAICQQLKRECELITQDWDGLIPALLARKFDAIIASMNITAERKRVVAFTDKYYQTPARFVARKDLILEILRGKPGKMTIGVQGATIHDNYLSDNFGGSVTIKRYGNLNEVYLDLKAGRLDMILADTVGLSEGFLNRKGNEAYQYFGPDLSDPKWFGEGIGIAVRKQDQTLLRQLNQAIHAIRENGTYQEIQARYFDFDIYGN